MLLKLIVGGFCLALSVSSHAYYFWDQGFNNPAVKTNYQSLSEGTYLNPITLVSPCLFSSGAFNGCPSNYQPPAPTSYGSASNAWWQNTSWSAPSFWVLANNNETVVLTNNYGPVSSSMSVCNSGPPNISLPRSAPGSGIFGFTAITDPGAGEYFYRAHLVLNQTFSNPCGDATPFLSIGAQDGRGQPGPLGALNPTPGVPSMLQFTAKVYDFKTPNPFPGAGGQPGTSVFRVYIVAEWPDDTGRPVPRMLFIDLFHMNVDDHLAGASDWNWPIQEDYLYPGADLAFFDAENIAATCGQVLAVPRLTLIGQQFTYNLDLQGLFRCASNQGLFRTAMPTTSNLPIRGIHWANEGTGVNGWLWTSVHAMYMY